jgi:hypothetical protein
MHGARLLRRIELHRNRRFAILAGGRASGAGAERCAGYRSNQEAGEHSPALILMLRLGSRAW